ncbi:MAG TPA: NUDIX domain-containing protein [Candidatus Thermoplasmatota archaeon]|jgi:ADP-ribose pyrophosphatase YjhB (NUDIX family)|nr:NUDIX domain-containing protein [Candidatus Thermoplasmatota archaeon]
MSLLHRGPALPERPHHWVNSDGLGLRLQCFLVVRDADRRVACVRLKDHGDRWSLPGESLKPNESPPMAAERIAQVWFGVPLPAKPAEVQNFPDDGDGKWYMVFTYEAPAPKAGLPLLDDTAEIAFAPVGKPPGPFAMSHADVFARLQA